MIESRLGETWSSGRPVHAPIGLLHSLVPGDLVAYLQAKQVRISEPMAQFRIGSEG